MDSHVFQQFKEADLWVRLLLAMIAGFLLGLPYRRRPGGVRTHLLVTLGSALFCTTGLEVAGETKGDVLRIIQGITSGIGFVGAASVLKKGTYIRGITTAASLWIAAAVGCEAALGNPVGAALLAPLIALISTLVSVLERRVFHRKHRMKLPTTGKRPRVQEHTPHHTRV